MSKQTEILARRIGAKLYSTGLSEREASIAATGKEYTIRYIRTRDAMPSAEKLSKIADVLGTTADWLLGHVDDEPSITPTPVPISEQLRGLSKDLPVFGTALGADEEYCTLEGEAVAIEQTDANMSAALDMMARPVALAGRDGFYVVTVAGSSMIPAFAPGRRVLVNGRGRAMIDDDVIVQMKRPVDEHGEFSAILIKRLLRRKAETVVLKQFNPELIFEVPVSRIHTIHPIMPWDEALGV